MRSRHWLPIALSQFRCISVTVITARPPNDRRERPEGPAEPQIEFGRHDARVAQSDLDLLQGRMALVSEMGVGTPHIMGRYGNSGPVGVHLQNVENGLLGESVTADPAPFVEAPKYAARPQAYRVGPPPNGGVNPVRNRNSPDAAVFTIQIGDDPTIFPLLQMFECQGAASPRRTLSRKAPPGDGAIPHAFHGGEVRVAQQRFRLFTGEPAAQAHTGVLGAFQRPMPAAISGASNPLSPASSASRRIAEMRTLTLADAKPLA